jgi:hypothetical protein
MSTGAECPARVDRDGDRIGGRLLPRRPDPATPDPHTAVVRAPSVLPALLHVVHRDDIEPERRLLGIDGVRPVELLHALWKDVEQQRELGLAADDDVAPQRNALLSLPKRPSDLP